MNVKKIFSLEFSAENLKIKNIDLSLIGKNNLTPFNEDSEIKI
ncbi:MAG: hypothetical protein WCB31_11025 [Nitrososphaeraceae archaeon]